MKATAELFEAYLKCPTKFWLLSKGTVGEGNAYADWVNEAAFVGAPFDSATTYRPGTRFGPQALRRISALYDGYWFDGGVDLYVLPYQTHLH
jgi:arginase family enzyme